MSETKLITVEFVDARSDCAHKETAQLPAGSQLLNVLTLLQIDPLSASCFGVFGEIKSLDYVLADGDRVEAYRPLLQDPKLKRIAKVNRLHLPRRCR